MTNDPIFLWHWIYEYHTQSCVVTMKIIIECDRDIETEMVVNQFLHKNSMMFLSTSQ